METVKNCYNNRFGQWNHAVYGDLEILEKHRL